jgi:hypothetical protein
MMPSFVFRSAESQSRLEHFRRKGETLLQPKFATKGSAQRQSARFQGRVQIPTSYVTDAAVHI